MQRLEVSGAVRPIYGSLGVRRLIGFFDIDGLVHHEYVPRGTDGK